MEEADSAKVAVGGHSTEAAAEADAAEAAVEDHFVHFVHLLRLASNTPQVPAATRGPPSTDGGVRPEAWLQASAVRPTRTCRGLTTLQHTYTRETSSSKRPSYAHQVPCADEAFLARI